jgi:glycosyltransferase involved in cell wall biosynthesis
MSVVLSVHNGQKHLREAIESVLSQSFKDFEFIILDDGSTDGSVEILQSYAVKDDRIQLVINEQNMGLTKSLNKGIALARGEYIARMDADDVCFPDRLGKQIEKLIQGNADICFTQCNIINSQTGQQSTTQYGSNLNHWKCLFGNYYGVHSSAIFNKEAVARLGGYDERFVLAQDYDLWDKAAHAGYKFAYTEDVLMDYFYRPSGISIQKILLQQQFAQAVSLRALSRYSPKASKNFLDFFILLFEDQSRIGDDFKIPDFFALSKLITCFCNRNDMVNRNDILKFLIQKTIRRIRMKKRLFVKIKLICSLLIFGILYLTP